MLVYLIFGTGIFGTHLLSAFLSFFLIIRESKSDLIKWFLQVVQ